MDAELGGPTRLPRLHGSHRHCRSRGAATLTSLLLFALAAGAADAGVTDTNSSANSSAGVTFHCVGACDAPRPVTPRRGGSALMGGHMYPGVTIASDLVPYRWFLERASGGDVLVLTADEAPCDIYNTFLLNMSGLPSSARPNSVSTACFTDRSGAMDAHLAKLLDGAAGIFLTGGDQAKYLDFWRSTPVAAALSAGAAAGPVVGGSSAGLAVQGQFVFDAEQGSVSSDEALSDPLGPAVSLTRDFLGVNDPWLRGVVTDTHFLQRDRMGRLVAFMAAAAAQRWDVGDGQHDNQPGVLGVGVSEKTAVLVGADGVATLAGVGPAYFLMSRGRLPSECLAGKPLSWAAPGIDVWRWNASDAAQATFDFGAWRWNATAPKATYALRVRKGKLESSQAGGSPY